VVGVVDGSAQAGDGAGQRLTVRSVGAQLIERQPQRLMCPPVIEEMLRLTFESFGRADVGVGFGHGGVVPGGSAEPNALSCR
jgi:hypothetical protein